MKRLLWIAMLVLLLAGVPAASAQPLALPPDVEHSGSVWTIYPHGLSPDDPERIREVVALADPGDTIRLAAGIFDFSEFENVYIYKDLTIEGAWDKKAGAPLTTIKHGQWPLLVGRKTPTAKPGTMDVAGHEVYHITAEPFGRLTAPIIYPPYAGGGDSYDVFDDWVAVHVNIRQITFEQPYGAAIWVGGQNGGVFERLNIQSAWPMDTEIADGWPQGFGIYWFGPGAAPITMGATDPELYIETDLIRGDRIVQDSMFTGDFAAIPAGLTDEAGDVVALPYDADSPMPPGGDYSRYVLQDVVFGWDAMGRADPSQTELYWVKKGYTVKNLPWLADPVRALRGLYGSLYSLWTEGTLTVRNNVMHGCDTGMIILENGSKGQPFTAAISHNEIELVQATDFYFNQTALYAYDFPVYYAATGEVIFPDPGMNVEFRDNEFVNRSQILGWWTPALDMNLYGSNLIEGNDIEIASGTGIWLWWSTQGATIERNRISGTGAWALAMNTDAHGNMLKANNLNGFEPAGSGMDSVDPPIPPAEILLLSNGNTVIGGGNHEPGVTVLDYGLDNTITGITRQVGRPLSAAERATINSAQDRK